MKNNKIKNGGKILATGGFGCIFSPALKCNGTKKTRKNTITKYAQQEYNTISKLNTILNKIPDYDNYFLINNFSLCKPSKLSNSDLTNFNKCETLKKHKITKKNINTSLDKVLALNMPYGGVTIDSFIMKNKSYEKLLIMNDKLIKLLISGILPMNKMNIYHNDIKDSNILIDYTNKDNVKVRLIDWGLTVHYIPFENKIFPKNWRNRPLQFNVPFSVVLFTDMFYDSYSNFLKEHEISSNNQNVNILLTTKKKELILFVKNYVKNWIKERGLGHYKYINKIMYMLFYHEITSITHKADVVNIKNTQVEHDQKKYIEKHYTSKFINNYLVEILLNFTSFRSDGTLNLREYLDNIFIKIVDVFGFTVSYFPLYELLFENYNVLNENQMLLFDNLKKIFLEYLYNPRVQPINIDNLVNNLKNINKIIGL